MRGGSWDWTYFLYGTTTQDGKHPLYGTCTRTLPVKHWDHFLFATKTFPVKDCGDTSCKRLGTLPAETLRYFL